MLNRTLIIKEIYKLSEKLFPDKNKHTTLFKSIWKDICKDQTFKKTIELLPSESLTPMWSKSLDSTIKHETHFKEYSILGIDGSQIYPDRHFSSSDCCLVNTGSCLLTYSSTSKAILRSTPEIYLNDKIERLKLKDITMQDFVNLERENLELKLGLEQALEIKTKPFIVLFDGGLIFWYLQSRHKTVKTYFLKQYIDTLQDFYDKKIIMGSFISFPKGKELANLIRVKLCCSKEQSYSPCFGKNPLCSCFLADLINDQDIIKWYVPKNTRTTIFYNRSKITKEYPDHLKPCYFYLNVGREISRIECPFWVTKDPKYLEIITKICLDQCEKGHGYPVALSEAHEQAVIKEPDRMFFYNLISKIGLKSNKTTVISQKNLKKRRMGI